MFDTDILMFWPVNELKEIIANVTCFTKYCNIFKKIIFHETEKYGKTEKNRES